MPLSQPEASIHSIEIDGWVITYVLRRSPRAKRARLEFRAESGLSVIIPRGYPLSRVAGLLLEKRRWVLARLAAWKPRAPRKAAPGVFYLGRRLRVIEQKDGSRVESTSLKRDALILKLRPGSDRQAVIDGWLRSQAEELILSSVQEMCSRLGVGYKRLSLRRARRRWGSCSPKGNLSFNWRVIGAPRPVIDYVVTHELCHLQEMNHSRRFWQLVERACPEWRRHRSWLRRHEDELMS